MKPEPFTTYARAMKSSARVARAITKGQHLLPSGYSTVLSGMREMIGESQRRTLSIVNRELVLLYWRIGREIVAQQERAAWGDSVVEQLSADLRVAFPDFKGLSPDNLFRMRRFYKTCRETNKWLHSMRSQHAAKGRKTSRNSASSRGRGGKVGTLSPQFRTTASGQLPPDVELNYPGLAEAVLSLSWSHHYKIFGNVSRSDEHYFYVSMSARERWSVRELQRQIDSDLFTRYVSVRNDPEKCLPEQPERGGLLPFKNHYVLDFLGLNELHSERQLRKAMLTKLREVFLEFGRDFTLVGEEHPITVGDDTYRVDLLLFHRRLQCLVVVELKKGKFRPEYVGKCQFYLAALDESARLPHEKPSVGLILCRDGDETEMRLALSLAARNVGVATYRTALPDERLIHEQLQRVSEPEE